MAIHVDYGEIALRNQKKHLPDSNAISNRKLKDFVDSCFAEALVQHSLAPCWVCVNCMSDGTPTFGWGRGPGKCLTCSERSVYQVATFNAWAPVVGAAFSAAAYHLLRSIYRIPMHETPGHTTTHDFEVTGLVALEAKGSPSTIKNPDGSNYQLKRPGLQRTDTEKKAFANAKTFRQRNPDAYFGVITNAMPARLLNYRDATVSGIFNLTRHEEIEVFVRDLGQTLDLEALRKQEFGSK